jgi:predicted RNase H-like nuclease
MLNGERLYRALAPTYPLLTDSRYSEGRVTFETFPHAVTSAMLGRAVASAKLKRHQRRQLPETAGIDTRALKSIDAIDAALCASTAKYLLEGRTHAYGDAAGGYILVPAV